MPSASQFAPVSASMQQLLVLMLVLLHVLVSITPVEAAVTMSGFETSGSCRSGNQFVCQNLLSGDCCDFIANNNAVQSVLFQGVKAGQWMSNYRPQATSGCGVMNEKRQMVHRATKTYRCLSATGITGSKWHRTEPIEGLLVQDNTSLNTTDCTRRVKAVLMTWNSTLRAYTAEGH